MMRMYWSNQGKVGELRDEIRRANQDRDYGGMVDLRDELDDTSQDGGFTGQLRTGMTHTYERRGCTISHTHMNLLEY